jgi:molybdopterin converting factor small subunit
MPVTVHLSTHVRSYTGGRRAVEAEGATLEQVLADLDQRYPGIRFRLVDEQGRPRQHMNFFVGAALVHELSSPIAAGEEVHILGALSGG